MLDVMEFIFSDLIHFIGTVILLETVFGGFRRLLNDPKQ